MKQGISRKLLCQSVDIGLLVTVMWSEFMFPEWGTSNSQQDQRQYLGPGVSGSFGKFRNFKFEDPTVSEPSYSTIDPNSYSLSSTLEALQ